MEIFAIIVVVPFCLALQVTVSLWLQEHHADHNRWMETKIDEMQRDLDKIKMDMIKRGKW